MSSVRKELRNELYWLIGLLKNEHKPLLDSLSHRQNYFLVIVTVYFLCTTPLAKKSVTETWAILILWILESELHIPQ